MKTLMLSLVGVAVLGGLLGVAAPPEPRLEDAGLPGFNGAVPVPVPETAPAVVAERKDVYPRWSVVGEWRGTHPVWTDVLTLHADGSITTAKMGTTGRWTLTAEGGTPLLVLRWDAFGTESLSMVGPNHFRGQIAPESFMDLRRGGEGGEGGQ